MFNFRRAQRIYLDHAAATPVRKEVMAAMQPYFAEHFANPGAIHEEGQVAKRAVERARLEVARVLGVRTDEVTWTASGTEANNLAILGTIKYHHEELKRPYEEIEIITSAIEHPSVIEACKEAERSGVKVKYVTLLEDGRIDRAALKALLSPKTVLLVFSYVNSEIGTVEDVKAITRLVRQFNQEEKAVVKVHLDAAQAPLWLPCKPEQLGVDMIALDAGKCQGPKGIGVLARRHGVLLKSVIHGGGQELGLRSGTENVPLIVGAAQALVLAQENFLERAERVKKVRDHALEQLIAIEGVHLNGSATHRVANNINISIDGVEAEFAVITLDAAGIACSTKSACGTGKGAGSSVIRALTGSEERALTSLRFTLGEDTSQSDVNKMLRILTAHIQTTRAFVQKLT